MKIAATILLLGWAAVPLVAQDTSKQHLEKAIKRMEAKEWAEAIPLLRAFIRVNRTAAPAWALLGQCHNKLGQWEDARTALEIARKLEPWRFRYAAELGKTYIALEEWNKAEEQLKVAQKVFPSSASLTLQLGIALLRQKKSAEARSAFRIVEAKNILLGPITRLYIIETYHQEGNKEEVRKEVEFYQDVFGPGELADRARRYLDPPGVQSADRLRLYARGVIEHDDNIAFLGERVSLPPGINHKQGERVVFSLSIAYDLVRNEGFLVTLGDSLDHSFHFQESELDFFRNTMQSSVEWFMIPDWSLRLSGSYNNSRLDNDAYSDSGFGDLRLRWIESDWTWSDLSWGLGTVHFSQSNSNEFLDRDAISWNIRLAQGFSFPKIGGVLYAGLGYRINNADGDDYDNDAFNVFVQWSSPVWEKLTVDAYLEWANEDYDNKNSVSGFLERRDDDRISANLTLRYPVYKGFSVMGYWQGLFVDSNIDFFEADKNVVGFGVEWRN